MLRRAALALVICCTLIGCAEDRDAGRIDYAPVAPQANRLDPALDAYWPNTDGSYWHYDAAYTEREFELRTLYPNRQSVPPAPTPFEVRKRFLGQVPTPPGGSLHRFQYALTFNGLITTYSGVTAQYLEESIIGGKGMLDSRPHEGTPDPLLAAIYRARPDLRAKLAAAHPELAEGGRLGYIPYLLYGYAWEKTTEYIGSYGDVDQLLSWKYLAADLSLGASFDQQLLPSLTDDLWLHGMIGRKFEYTLPNGERHPAIECDYVIDFGVSNWRDGQANSRGYWRWYDYGKVVYVADVGPVACTERGSLEAGDSTGMSLTDHRVAMTVYQIAAP